MKLRYKIVLAIAVICVCYYGIWYSWSLYLLNSFNKDIKDRLLTNNISLSYDHLKIRGFPFSILYCIDNVSFFLINTNTKITSKITCVELDLFGSDFNISLSKDFYVVDDGIELFNIKFNSYPEIDISLDTSMLQMIMRGKSFAPTEIDSLSYSDHGYSIYEPNTDEIIFISKHNLVDITTALLYPNEYSIRFIASLNGQGNKIEHGILGEHELRADFILKTSKDSSNRINDLTFSIIKGIISTQLYELVASGDMNYKRHFGFNGQINVTLLNFNHLTTFLKPILKPEQLDKFIKILTAINENPQSKTSNNKDISFRIRGEKNNIRWGRLSDYKLMEEKNK